MATLLIRASNDRADQEQDCQDNQTGTNNVSKLPKEVIKHRTAWLLSWVLASIPTRWILAAVHNRRNNLPKFFFLIMVPNPCKDSVTQDPNADGTCNQDQHEDNEDKPKDSLRTLFSTA